MRPFYLFLSLFCLLALVACGTEEELTQPTFSNITASGSLDSPTILTAPSQDLDVTISGNIDDLAATIVANSTVTGEVSVPVSSIDGSWSIPPFDPLEGANIVSVTATDKRGNINQLVLTVFHDTTAPLVTAVVQSVDPSPQIVVTFNEALLEASLATALFAVDGGTPIAAAPYDSLKPKTVTLPLSEALITGDHILTYDGVTDIATPTGNSTDNTPTTFKIQ